MIKRRQGAVKVEARSFAALFAAALGRRAGLISSGVTDAMRLFGGAADGMDGVYVDRYGPGCVLILYEGRVPSEFDAAGAAGAILTATRAAGVRAVYLKPFARDRSRLGGEGPEELTDPQPLAGDALDESVVVTEHGLKFEARLYDGFSAGLFADQRENRRFLASWVRSRGASKISHAPRPPARPRIGVHWSVDDPKEPPRAATAPPPKELRGAKVLNTFAYTCGFSVACAVAGAATTSVDVSGKYLDWGKRNFTLNGLDAQSHRFARMDTFEFIQYAQRKGLSYDLIILDPPSFATANKKKKIPAWSSTQHFPKLIREAAEILTPGGAIFASTNTRELCLPGRFDREIEKGLEKRPEFIKLPAYPPDFAMESDRFTARMFVIR